MRGGTTIAGEPGHGWRRRSAFGMELVSRITVVGVSATDCFSFSRHLPGSSDCFAVIVEQSSWRGVFSAAIKQR